MASNDLDLNVLSYQDNLRTKPVRENFQNIETEFNALRGEVNAGIASTASEVTSARHNMDTLSDNIELRKVWKNRIVQDDDLQVSAIGTPIMAVSIGTGAGIVEGNGVQLTAAVTSATIATAASGKHRLDAVVIDKTNSAFIKEGAEVSTSSAVVYPEILSSEMILAHFNVNNTTTSITTAQIIDDRLLAINPFEDYDLLNKSFTFNATTNNINTIIVTTKEGLTNTYNFSYTGDLISTVGITIDNLRYVNTFTYNATTDNIESQEITVS
jgi:hypothetical protein